MENIRKERNIKFQGNGKTKKEVNQKEIFDWNDRSIRIDSDFEQRDNRSVSGCRSIDCLGMI